MNGARGTSGTPTRVNRHDRRAGRRVRPWTTATLAVVALLATIGAVLPAAAQTATPSPSPSPATVTPAPTVNSPAETPPPVATPGPQETFTGERRTEDVGVDNGVELLTDGAVATLQENATSRPLYVPGTVTADKVTVTDAATGAPIALTGEKTRTVGDRTELFIPQLPLGEFTVTSPAGTATIVIGDPQNLVGLQRDTSNPLVYAGLVALVIAAAGAGTAVVLHRRGRRRGSVLVLTAGALAATAAAAVTVLTLAPSDWRSCPTSGRESFTCRIAAYVDVADRSGNRAMMNALQEASDRQCHSIAHEVGYVLWRRDRNLDKAIARANYGCANGVIHGTVEAMAVYADDEQFPQLLTRYCTSFADELAQLTCFHGGGHASIWRTNGDLVHAFTICDQVQNPYGEYECHGSAVMEWADRWSAAKQQQVPARLVPDVSEPMQICVLGPKDDLFRAGCYIGTNHRTGDANAAARWCLEKEQGLYLGSCFSALGENLLAFTYLAHPHEPGVSIDEALQHRQLCDRGTASARERCSLKIPYVLADMQKSPTKARALCQAYPADLQAKCLDVSTRLLDRLQAQGEVLTP